jgi:hypothetical protein
MRAISHSSLGSSNLKPISVVLCLFSGCVAIPPLINVQHTEPKDSTEALKMRVEQLERRVNELETKQERR